MTRLRYLATMSLALSILSGSVSPPVDDADAHEIVSLRQQIAKLESILEGTAGPVNLGRTSLATVDASSVNGSRAISNEFYGVLNAFDDGDNWINSLNYTYWLTSGEPSPWIEVRFDHPVTVQSIATESAPPFTTRLGLAQGGEIDLPRSQGLCTPVEPVHGVTSARLTFDSGGNVQVNEVRILGHVTPTVEWTTAAPRIHLTDRGVTAIATEAFEQWRSTLRGGVTHSIEDADGHKIVTFHRAGQDLLRVTVRTSDLRVETETLVMLTPIRGQRDE